jgi:hypothetical protein
MPLTNQPKIVRGAFEEYGLSIPPLFVVFQFNPDQLSRSRSLYYSVPGQRQREQSQRAQEARERDNFAVPYSVSLRDFHGEYDDLTELRDAQQVNIQPESINFEIRLDATDKLNDGDAITGEFGVSPELATLELMVHPKEEGLLGAVLGPLVGSAEGHSFTRKPNPPLVLFIWGAKRVLPVNINSMSITETEFSTTLDPRRATVAVNLTVIEGPNIPYTYSRVLKGVSSALNLTNIGDIANVVIPS